MTKVEAFEVGPHTFVADSVFFVATAAASLESAPVPVANGSPDDGI